MNIMEMSADDREKVRIEAKAKGELKIKTFIDAMTKSGNKQDKQKLMFLKTTPKKYQLAWVKSQLGELTLGKASKLHCIECSGWSLPEAKDCCAFLCPMHNHRPK